MVWISIEGLIGSGKTTVVERLSKEYSNDNIGIYKEPVESWQSCLDLYYINNQRNSFLMQIRANTSFIKIYNSFQNKNMVITERSSYSSQNVFGKMLTEQGIMSNTEFELSTELVNATQQNIPDFFIYLKSTPDVCYDRIIKRGDKPIYKEYLRLLDEYHDQVFLNKLNVFVIEVNNMSKDCVFERILYIIRSINSSK